MRDDGDLRFGRFQLRRRQRRLLMDGAPVEVGARAIDVLLALIDAGGEPLSKEALIDRVWSGVAVEEHNLTVQIHALRKALGPDRDLIRTIARHGYSFAGEVEVLGVTADADAAPAAPARIPATNLLTQIEALIGRDEEVQELLDLQSRCRLLTLTGPGGIGKTRLAIEIARLLLPSLPDGVWLADLATLSDPGLVPGRIASVLGLQPGSMQTVAAALAGKNLLLVLDNCEHVVAEAARAAHALLRGSSSARILATSREPLGVEGELVYRVPALTTPAAHVKDADDILRHGAVRLFVTRVCAADARFRADDAELAAIAAICRRLDGIPLAIELAAARAASLGLDGLLALLDDRLALLTGGRRTALPRHQTLQATLDWSHDLLNEPERVVLRRMAVFSGAFTLKAARAVGAEGKFAPSDVVNCVLSLIEKSLISSKSDGTGTRYQLLETTRAYALEKLVASGEVNAIRRRHAEYYRDMLQAAAEDKSAIDNWPAAYEAEIGNIQAALAWAFASGGDTSIGVALAAASVPIWLEMSLLTECHGWVEKALGVLEAADSTARTEMILQCALGYSLMFARGTSDLARTALARANELAESLTDLDYQLRTLAGLAAMRQRLQDFQGAVALGRRAEEVVTGSSDPIALSTVDYILGSSLQLLGEYEEALAYAQRNYVRSTVVPAVRRAHIARLGRDSLISAGSTVAIIRWTQGLLDRSAEVARNVLADAEAGHHPFSLCLALAWCGCIVPLRLGDLHTAERSIARLKDFAQSYGLNNDYAHGLCFEGQLSAKRGDVLAGEQLLRAGLQKLQQAPNASFYTVFLTGLAEVLMMSTHLDQGLAAADEALQRTEQSNALWWLPEALRIKGEVLLLCRRDTNAAEDHFRRSLDLAHRQGALSWELRAATSLARLWVKTGRNAGANSLLQPVYARFTEGLDTADLRAAKQLLEESEQVPGSRCMTPMS